ncbi:MAG TPA: hypothetical protein VF070_39910 [Streptosporangiaceae bacterium]
MWHDFSSDEFDQVARLSVQETSIPAGAGRALVVGADGVVRDDSWIEVFQAASGAVALVQASGPDYPGALAAALDYPDAEDDDGDTLKVSSGELAIFSAAQDGAGPYSTPWAPPGLDQCLPCTARRRTRWTKGCCSRPCTPRTGSRSAGTPESVKTAASRGGSSSRHGTATDQSA